MWTWTTITTNVLHDSWTLISAVPNLAWGGTLQDAWFILNTAASTSNIWVDDCSLQRAVVEAPVISPGSGPFSDSVVVTVQCATAGATIYYTSDNSTPTTTSPVYLGPFPLRGGTTVGTCSFTANLGWDSYFDVILPNIALPGGTHTLTVTFNTAGTTLDYIEATTPTGALISVR